MVRRHKAFTLIELLVVIAVIGILVGILLPALNAVRKRARLIQCTTNIRSTGQAMLTYEAQHKKFPIGVQLRSLETRGTTEGYFGDIVGVSGHNGKYTGTTAFALILADMEETRAFEMYDFGEAYYADVNDGEQREAVSTRVASYQCPADISRDRLAQLPESTQYKGVKLARSNYVLCFGTGSIFRDSDNADTDGAFRADGSRTMSDLVDGASKTVLLSEVMAGREDGRGGGSIKKIDVRGLWACELAGAAIYTHFWEPNSLEGDEINAYLKTGGVYCWDTDPRMPCNRKPGSYGTDFATARSDHGAGVNAFFADGRVAFVDETIDLDVWKAAATIDNARYEPKVTIAN